MVSNRSCSSTMKLSHITSVRQSVQRNIASSLPGIDERRVTEKALEDLELLKGDIVGVAALREDGWAIGEPVNETRRQLGRYLFPSKLVCLF